MARSRVTSTSTLVMIPRSEPSDSTTSSSERSHQSRDGGSAPVRSLPGSLVFIGHRGTRFVLLLVLASATIRFSADMHAPTHDELDSRRRPDQALRHRKGG